MKVWIIFCSPYESLIEGVFDSEEKAETYRLKRMKEWKEHTGQWPKKIGGTPYFYKRKFEVL